MEEFFSESEYNEYQDSLWGTDMDLSIRQMLKRYPDHAKEIFIDLFEPGDEQEFITEEIIDLFIEHGINVNDFRNQIEMNCHLDFVELFLKKGYIPNEYTLDNVIGDVTYPDVNEESINEFIDLIEKYGYPCEVHRDIVRYYYSDILSRDMPKESVFDRCRIVNEEEKENIDK